MEPITSFADWARQQRRRLGLTQAQLAVRVGCAAVTIKKIEQGMRRPSPEMAEALAHALEIPNAERDAFFRLARHEHVDPATLPSVTANTATFVASTVPIARETGARASGARATSFVARTQELAQLDAHLTGVLNGSGRMVFIAGEAGYGKTSLMTEFARRAQRTYPELIVCGGNCEAHAGAGNPYLPFRDMTAALTCDAEIIEQVGLQTAEQTRRLWASLPHIAHALCAHGPDLIDVFVAGARLQQRVLTHPSAKTTCGPEIAALVARQEVRGNVPQRRLFEQFAQVLRALAQRQPLLLLLDDLHWLDGASADLLFYLARRLTGAPILLLGTYRRSEVSNGEASHPEERLPSDAHPLVPLLQELKRRAGDIEIDLGRSTPETDRAFVDLLIESRPNRLTQAFRDELFRRTWGHPLFTVELLRDLQERGALVQNEHGQWVESATVDWETLPARVDAVISRRIGRLPPMLQEALKIASVEGESFTAEVIARILGVDAWAMVQQLSGTAGRQHHLVTAQGHQRLGAQLFSRYRFGHSLFQSWLYGNMDAAERAYLHEAVGNALETLAADKTESVAVQLAHHFQIAGLATKAIDYLGQAGRQAVALSAHQEAIAHLTAALELLSNLPPTRARDRLELQLQTDLGVSYKITRGFAAPEVETVYRRAQVLCEPEGDPVALASVLWGLHSVYSVRGDMKLAAENAQACLALAQHDPLLRVTGHFVVGCSMAHTGQLTAARMHLEQARSAYSAQQHMAFVLLAGIDLGVFTLAHLSHTLCYLGYPDQALQMSQQSVETARALNHPFTLASALSYQTMLHQLRGDRHAVEATSTTAVGICVEHDIPYYRAWNSFLTGWASVGRGAIDAGVAQMTQSLTDLQTIHTGLRRPYYLGLLAEAQGKAGRTESALRLIENACATAKRQGEALYQPELHRIRGVLLEGRGAAGDEIEACFARAVDMARGQEAKLSELRAATALARAYRAQGETARARRTLADVADWFGEGFTLEDMQEATALLAALA